MYSFQSGTIKDSYFVSLVVLAFYVWHNKAHVPKWFDITYLPNNVVSTITAMGNPAVWWIGFACVLR